MKDGNFWDWCLSSSPRSPASRHGWAIRGRRAEEAAATGTVSRGISLAETISAVVTAPALGLIAGGLGDYLGMSTGTIYAMAGLPGWAACAAVRGVGPDYRGPC